MATTIQGQAGEVRWGYQRVALVRSWSVVVDSARGALTGSVSVLNAMGLAQPGLTFRVPRGPRATPWVWPVVGLQVAGEQITAEPGPQE